MRGRPEIPYAHISDHYPVIILRLSGSRLLGGRWLCYAPEYLGIGVCLPTGRCIVYCVPVAAEAIADLNKQIKLCKMVPHRRREVGYIDERNDGNLCNMSKSRYMESMWAWEVC